MSDRVARRRDATRERIFRVAMDLFAERGFESVTVADIAEAADIGKGTFFTHFPTKADLFRHVSEQVTTAMAAAVEGAAGACVSDRLRAALAAAAAQYEADPAPLIQMVRSRSFNLSLDIGSANQQRVRRLFATLVQEGQESGAFRRDVDVDDAVVALVGGLLGNVLLWGLDPTGRPLHERLETALDLALNGLA